MLARPVWNSLWSGFVFFSVCECSVPVVFDYPTISYGCLIVIVNSLFMGIGVRALYIAYRIFYTFGPNSKPNGVFAYGWQQNLRRIRMIGAYPIHWGTAIDWRVERFRAIQRRCQRDLPRVEDAWAITWHLI